MDKLFKGLFDTELVTTISVSDFLLCLGISLILGVLIALSYLVKNNYTKSFLVTLSLMPSIVCVIIMMVNGNIGAGVAVAGAFSLVRFRSAPGSAKEIAAIFLAMGAGLVSGMGYLAFSILFTVMTCAFFILSNCVCDIITDNRKRSRIFKITIPEDLDYTGVFDGIFSEYASSYELVKVKTVNLGSMFRLTYNVLLKDISSEKAVIDRIRERNGNLEIFVSRPEQSADEL